MPHSRAPVGQAKPQPRQKRRFRAPVLPLWSTCMSPRASRRSGRVAAGVGRVLERVEREVLAGIGHPPIQGDVTVLRVPFETEDDFDRRVDDVMVAIALTAEQHRCTSESSSWAEVAGERWRWRP